VGTTGERFDPNYHEAIAALPAPSSEQVDQVAAVFQIGYRFDGVLLRPARVQVFVAPEESGETET
jgi:molecular chaperone GrpE